MTQKKQHQVKQEWNRYSKSYYQQQQQQLVDVSIEPHEVVSKTQNRQKKKEDMRRVFKNTNCIIQIISFILELYELGLLIESQQDRLSATFDYSSVYLILYLFDWFKRYIN